MANTEGRLFFFLPFVKRQCLCDTFFFKKVEYIMLFFKMIFYRMIADVSSFEEV